jgi:hypothetical protein
MAKKKRLSPNQLAELKKDYAGLKTIDDYNPQKVEYKTEKVEEVDTKLDNLIDLRAQKKAELDNLDDEIADTGKDYTQVMKGARQQVVAQYGDDSPEYEAVGGTRISNRKSGLHRGNGGNNTPNG